MFVRVHACVHALASASRKPMVTCRVTQNLTNVHACIHALASASREVNRARWATERTTPTPRRGQSFAHTSYEEASVPPVGSQQRLGLLPRHHPKVPALVKRSVCSKHVWVWLVWTASEVGESEGKGQRVKGGTCTFTAVLSVHRNNGLCLERTKTKRQVWARRTLREET